MNYELLDKLMPNESNSKELQEKIDLFMSVNPGISEEAFNEILAEMEMQGFAKGVKVGLKLGTELEI